MTTIVGPELTDDEAQILFGELAAVRKHADDWKNVGRKWWTFWTVVYFSCGILSVVASGIAGISGVAGDNATLAGWLAGVGAVLAAVVTFTRADKRRVAHLDGLYAYDRS